MTKRNKQCEVRDSIDQESVTDAYLDVEQMLFKICHQFNNRYNLPFDELMSEARYQFMKAYRRFDPSKGAKLSTFVYFVVSHKLIDHVSKEFKWSNHSAEMPDDLEPGEVLANTLMGMVEFLTDDAREVLGLVMESPRDFSNRLVLDGRSCSRWCATLKSPGGHPSELTWRW